MSGLVTPLPPREAAHVVRDYYDSLSHGRMIDALNLFATDAVVTDEKGKESKGITAIAASLLEYRKPNALSLDVVEDRGGDVTALFHKDRNHRYRGTFSIDHGRIRSVRVERLS
ncbi:MAG TPA: hypothetical protein VEO20_00435 [Thermoplasmata archaeon]|nr:hypothetical protein [Thermoplasmata archaeon]